MHFSYRFLLLTSLGLLLLIAAGLADTGSVITPIDQGQFYQGTPDECWNKEDLRRSTQTDFEEAIPPDIGSPTTPLYFAIGVHIEPQQGYMDDRRYRVDRERLTRLAALVERHGGKLTIQAQSPFTAKALQLGDPLFTELAAQGHEIALHFHEDAHIPDADRQPVERWITAFQQEMGLIERLSGQPVFTWSGGNLYPHVFEAAALAGLRTNINYKNPSTQQIDPRFLVLTPWRPAGAETVDQRTTHDPNGPIVYVPSGVWPAHCPKAEAFPRPYNYEAFDYVTVALRNSLNAVVEGKINTFIATLHPGDFLELDDDEQDLQIWDEWLTEIIDPLVASGRLRWATASEMAAAFTSWEESQIEAEPAPAPSLNLILISWDGVQREHLLELYRQGLLPNLEALGREGSMMPMEVIGHATDTKAGHAEMLSGYGPEVTGVYSNQRYQAIPEGLTVFERLKARFGRGIATLAITGKRTNLIEILENTLPELDFVLIRGATAEQNGPVMLRALETLKEQPFFAFFHFSDPDHAGHAHGENSQEYSEAILTCDLWLGEIVAKLRELGIYEKTLIYVTTDHGFDEGRKSHRDAPAIWLVTNDPGVAQPEDRPASQGDIAPTILERFGIDLNSIEPPLLGRSLFPGPVSAASVTIEREIVFATVEGLPLKLDAYRPELPGPLPAIIFVHGGGWVGGDKRGMEPYARYFAERGYVGFAVNYRLAPGFKFPAQIEDVKCAVRWVRQHAAEYNVDPDRIGALGTSAGGHLVGLLGVTDGSEGLEGACGDPAISSRVQAVAPYFGPMDLVELFSGTEHGAQMAMKLFGTTCEASPETCRRASPIAHVSPDDPPFMLVHGTLDPVVPFEQSVSMEHALQTAGVEVELVPIEGAGHGWPIDSPFGEQALTQVAAFFERHLKGAVASNPETGDGRAYDMGKVDFNGSVKADCPGNTLRCETPEEAIQERVDAGAKIRFVTPRELQESFERRRGNPSSVNER